MFFLCLERRHSYAITTTAARYSSEDAVILVEYVLSLLEYTKRYKPYRKVIDYITELAVEQEEHERVADDDRYSVDDLQEEKVHTYIRTYINELVFVCEMQKSAQ